jgi:diadenosine tetraphosphate (Ap4A) HIT family hydrolase
VVVNFQGRPKNKGHMLIVTRLHFRNLYDLPTALDAQLLGCARRTAQAVPSERDDLVYCG